MLQQVRFELEFGHKYNSGKDINGINVEDSLLHKI